MMEWFSYNWLLYGMSLMSLSMVITMTINSNILSKHRLDRQNDEKLQQLINK